MKPDYLMTDVFMINSENVYPVFAGCIIFTIIGIILMYYNMFDIFASFPAVVWINKKSSHASQ